MLQNLLITLREGLEISLLLVIILAYLKKTGRTDLFVSVWQGTGLAVLISVIAGSTLFALGSELEGKGEEIFEGIIMLSAVVVLSWMIIWMKSQARQLRGDIQVRIDRALARGSIIGMVALAFFVVIREGLETALLLFTASRTADPIAATIGGLVGLTVAIAIGGVIYQGSHRIDLRMFFNITGVLLILFAAGLLARGVHEFQEAGLIYILVEHVWDINGVLSENSTIGSLAKGLFGYNGNPSLVEVLVYPLYLVTTLYFFLAPVSKHLPSKTPATQTTDQPS